MNIEIELAEHKDVLIKLKRQKCLISPTIYISESVNKTGTRFFIGRGHWTNKDLSNKVLSVYLGKTDVFNPQNDQHVSIAKEKLIKQFQKQLLSGKIN